MNTLGDRIKEVRTEAGLTGAAFGELIFVTKSYVSQLESGVRNNLDPLKIEQICRRFSVNRKWLESGEGPKRYTESTAESKVSVSKPESKEKDKKSTATPVGVTLIPVYGMAQALGYRPHHGDVIPENIYALPNVAIVDDGRQYAAFRVEGRSMEPTLAEGVIVLCDLHREPTNKCVVCCKWNDTVVVKRWRQVGDQIILTSDNPAFGEEYTVKARDVDWCLRVKKVLSDLP